MPSQLGIQRRITRSFINSDPTVIAFRPSVETKVPGKGIVKTLGPARSDASYKVIYDGSDGYRSGEDGSYHKYDVIIVGLYDCEAQIGDVWKAENGQKYIIHSEYPQNNYERKFGLISYGKQAVSG